MGRIKENCFASTVTLLAVFFLFYVHDILHIGTPAVLYMAVIVLGSMFFKQEDYILFGCSIPLFINGLSLIGYGFGLVIIIYYAKMILRSRADGFRIKHNKYLVLMLLLMVNELFAYSRFGEFDLQAYLSTAFTYFLFAIAFFEIKGVDNQRIESISRRYVFMFLVLLIELLLQTLLYSSIGEMIVNGLRFGAVIQQNRFDNTGNLGMDKNTIALLCLLTMTICCYLSQSSKEKKYYIVLGTALFFGLLTLSKTFLLMLAVFAMLLFISNAAKGRFSKNQLIGLPALAIAVVCIVLFVTPINTLVVNLLNRFTVTDTSKTYGTLTTGRDLIFAYYNRFMLENPKYWLTGVGLKNIGVVVQRFQGATTHNAIQDIFVCCGVFGIVIFTLFFAQMFKDAKKTRKRKNSFDNLILFFIYVLFIQSIQFVRLANIYYNLLLVFLWLCYRFEKNDDHDHNEVLIEEG